MTKMNKLREQQMQLVKEAERQRQIEEKRIEDQRLKEEERSRIFQMRLKKRNGSRAGSATSR